MALNLLNMYSKVRLPVKLSITTTKNGHTVSMFCIGTEQFIPKRLPKTAWGKKKIEITVKTDIMWFKNF